MNFEFSLMILVTKNSIRIPIILEFFLDSNGEAIRCEAFTPVNS